VYPRLGHRPLRSIRHSDIQSLISHLSKDKDLAPWSVRGVFTWVRAVFRAAQHDRIITFSPCDEIKLPMIEEGPVHPFSIEQVFGMADIVPDRYRAWILAGAGTGVRISESLAITSDRIDWIRKELTVDRQLAGSRKGEPVFAPLKDRHNLPRTIPLPEPLVTELAEHVRVFGLGPEGLLFTNNVSNPIWRSCASEVWRKAADEMGIPEGEGFHQLRHHYASLLIHDGHDVTVVADRLGDTKEMVWKVYAHLWPGSEDRTRDTISRAWAAAAPNPRQIQTAE
jgi:integrase